MDYKSYGKELVKLCSFCFGKRIFFLKMKLTFALSFLFFIGVQAHIKGQNVSLIFKGAQLETVLKTITKQTDYKFFYSSNLLKNTSLVDISVKNEPLENVLETILSERSLNHKTTARTITIFKNEAIDVIAQVSVTGVVSDSLSVLSGVSIRAKNDSNIGTNTDQYGRFSISVPHNTVLIFSMIGYESKEVLASHINMEVTLQGISQEVEEVVVTALGISKERRKVSYAIQSVKGTEMQLAREPNLASSLAGKVAGLRVGSQSTLFETPGIALRGGVTTIVIDGVPAPDGFDMWSLNADDIEDITVLKGAASSALYGSVAQNGAIMITTKKGKGGGTGIDLVYSSSTQFQAGFLRIPETQEEYGMGFNGKYAFLDGKGGGVNDNYGYVWGPKLNQKDPTTESGFVEITQYNSQINPKTNQLIALPWVTRGSNNLTNFLNKGLITTHNLSVAGTTEKSDYRISLSHMYQKGQVPNTKLNGTTLNLAGNLKINSRLEAEATLSYNKQYSPNYPNSLYSPDNFFYNIVLWMGPDVDIRDLRSYWKPGREGLEQLTYNYSWYNNPWYSAYEKERRYNNDVLVSQANLKYKVFDDLKLMVRGGVSSNFANSENRIPYTYIDYVAAPYGNFSTNRNNRMRLVSDVLMTYDKNIFKDVSLTASLGGSVRLDQYEALQSNTTGGLSVPGWYNLGNSRDPIQSSNERIEKQVYGLYGYVDIAYRNWMTLSITGRNDWTSALIAPNHSYFYPSASLSLILSDLIKLPSEISMFKLRAAVTDATTDVLPYSTLATYDIGNRWNGNPSLILPETLRKEGLKPNKTISQEYGAEFKFFNNRVGADVTFFNYDLTNNVVDVPLSYATGYLEMQINGDKYRRSGLEVVLDGLPIRTQNFTWQTRINYSHLRNKVVDFYGEEKIRGGVEEGERSDVYRGRAWEKSPEGQIVHVNGIPKYLNQEVNVGYFLPDWEFGFANTFKYKNYALSVSIDGRIGGKMYDGVEAKLFEGGMHRSTANKYRDDAYVGEKTYIAKGVKVTGGDVSYDVKGKVISDTRTFAPNDISVNYIDWVFATHTTTVTEASLYDRSFVKLREVTLSYQMPEDWIKRTPFKSASFSIVGRNLFLWSKVPFMDPDGYIDGALNPDGYRDLRLAEPSARNIGFNLFMKF